MLKKIQALVQSQSHCALATSSADGRPHVSLMAFCAAPDLAEFWLATRQDTRKYRNLEENPRASLLIDDRDRAGADAAPDAGPDAEPEDAPGFALTVTAELVAFDGPEHAAAVQSMVLESNGDMATFLGTPGVVLLRLAVRRLQLLYGPSEEFIVEVEKTLDGERWKA